MSSKLSTRSLSELLFGLKDTLDDEGRPLGERRASSRAKRGCPMKLVPCPYPDIRQGMPMNRSSLDQILRHLKAAHHDIAGFHAMLPAGLGAWERMSMAVLDRLAAPAAHVLCWPATPLPAPVAVGHKLAEGYFQVLEQVLTMELMGQPQEPTPEHFLDVVAEHGALVGASEVCAGPPKLIRRTTHLFFHGRRGAAPGTDVWRPALARGLYHQTLCRLAWSIFDGGVEASLLELISRQLRPRNRFIADQLRTRIVEIEHRGLRAEQRPKGPLLVGMPAALRDPLVFAIADHDGDRAELGAVRELESVFDREGAALVGGSPALLSTICSRFATYLAVFEALVQTQLRLATELRITLGCSPARPPALGALAVPRPRARRWFEAALGVSARCREGAAPNLRPKRRRP